MKTLEKYEEICMNYFNGNISDFKRDLKRLTKKEILTLAFQLACRLGREDRLGDVPDHAQANNIIHKYL